MDLTPTSLSNAAGISVPYASQILADPPVRTPSRALAIHIFRKTGWRHPLIEGLTEEQMEVLEAVDPWTPRQAEAA